MRFTSSTCLLFVLVTLLAATSFVSSLSIRRAADIAVFPDRDVQLLKRAPRAVSSSTSTNKPPGSTDRTSAPASGTHAPTSRANSTGGASDSASSMATQSVPPTASANMSATTDQNMTSTMSNGTAATSTSTASSGGGGVSTSLIAAIGGIAGALVIGGLAFVFLRQKNKNVSQNLASKSVSQFQASAPYTSPPYNTTGNTGYERLSDPSLPVPNNNNASTPSVGTFTVISTYTPTLGDELEIQPGDKVTILVEYDDGWCQGVNESRGRVKGVFPKHCVDMGNSMDDPVRGKRVSSMYGNGYRM